jgi:Subtilase family
MQLHASRVNHNLEPRLQAAVARHRAGERTVATAASSPDEISVVALVSDLEAWRAHSEVREGVTLGKTDGGVVVTARLPLGRIDAIRDAPEVDGMKAAQPLSRMLGATVRELGADPAALPADLRCSGGEGVIVGIVDYGADIAHRNIRRGDGSTRLLALWDQSGPTTADSPVGYGSRYSAHDIDAALQTGDPYAALGYGPAPDTAEEQGSHGTHVMDIAAGNGGGSGVAGVAPQTDIIFVDPAVSDVAWQGGAVLGSTFGDSVQLLEALHFVFEEAGDRPCVVNVSLGTNGGSHDGRSLVERGIDALLDRPNRAVVIAASNSYNDGIHAAGSVAQGGSADLVWRLPPRPGEHELEVWYSGADEFAAEIVDPDGNSLGTVALGDSAEATAADDGRTLLFVSHRAADPSNGDNVLGIFVGAGAPGPAWTIRLHGASIGGDGGYHAWIERADWAQSSFEPPHDNSHTVGSISCGNKSVVVGSYDAHKAAVPLSWFSSAGPTRDGREKPEVSAPGHDVLAAHSRTGTGVTLKSGTSMSAPAVTGLIALVVGEAAARGQQLDADRILEIVLASARSDPPPAGAWDARYGHGRVSVTEALNQLA